MTALEQALRADIRHRLENEEFRYTDNSFAFIRLRDREAMERDREYLALWGAPAFDEFCARNADALRCQVERCSFLYGVLEDEYSRRTLVTRIAYLLLGHLFVKFDHYPPGYFETLDTLDRELAVEGHPDFTANEHVDEFGIGDPLVLYDLSRAGLAARFYSTPLMLYALLRDKPYRYAHGRTLVEVARGDYVFDCGAAFCDTALSFSLQAGGEGRIFSYDPNPFMEHVGRFNLGLNGPCGERVRFFGLGVTNRVSDGVKLFVYGQGSTIDKGTDVGLPSTTIRTSTIDHEVRRNGIPKVDFIKMDIEGSELAALAGAMKTLHAFRPKLAISVYHQPDDLYAIPKFIHELGLGYKLYLEHHSPIIYETILYAMAE